MEWINFRHLYSFWMVSQTKNFTAAAKKMMVAQSAVSDQVSQLEGYLGEKLFIRSTRRLELTDSGIHLLNYADIIFENSKEINSFIKDGKYPSEAKKLNIGIVGGVSRNFVYRVLQSFIEQHSETTINVITGSFHELTSSLKKFELDMLITLELPKKKDLDEFTYQKIGHSKLILAGPKPLVSSIESKRRKKAIEIYKFSHPYETEILNNIIKPSIGVDPLLRLTTDDIPLLRFFCHSKDGLVLIPKIGVLEDIQKGRLSFIELKKCPEINIYGVFSKKGTHQKRVSEFLRDIHAVDV